MKINQKNFTLTNCCVGATSACFLIAWGLIPPIFGLKEFDSGSIKESLFLAIAPGIIIGAIIYYIVRSDDKKLVTDSYENVSKYISNTGSQSQPSLSDQLREIKKLQEDGILSEEEFIRLKKEILEKN